MVFVTKSEMNFIRMYLNQQAFADHIFLGGCRAKLHGCHLKEKQ